MDYRYGSGDVEPFFFSWIPPIDPKAASVYSNDFGIVYHIRQPFNSVALSRQSTSAKENNGRLGFGSMVMAPAVAVAVTVPVLPPQHQWGSMKTLLGVVIPDDTIQSSWIDETDNKEQINIPTEPIELLSLQTSNVVNSSTTGNVVLRLVSIVA